MERITVNASSAAALVFAMAPHAFAQEDVGVLSYWAYDGLYAEGWSVEIMFGTTEVIDANGEAIGDVENVIFSNEGEVVGIIAEVRGIRDIGDTHVHVPWTEVTLADGNQQVQVPVTESTIDSYDVFDATWGSNQVLTESDTDGTQPVDHDLEAASGIFKATDLIGSYAYLSGDVNYGYIADIIVQDDAISAIIIDAIAYGRAGYYAYPYGYYGTSPMGTARYDMPYEAAEIDTIDSFDYEQLQSSGAD